MFRADEFLMIVFCSICKAKTMKERYSAIFNMYFKLLRGEIGHRLSYLTAEDRRVAERNIPPLTEADIFFDNNVSTSKLCSWAHYSGSTYKQSFVIIRYSMYSRIVNSLRNIAMSSVSKPEVIFVLGGPGAGKGTQCTNIVEKFGYVHLSAGELLRDEQQKPGSKFGELIEGHMVNGTIVPVEITCSLLAQAMESATTNKFLIDGFPRNNNNLDGWNKVMSDKVKLLGVLFFDCSEQTCIDRCLRRGAAGSGRSDDNEDTLKKRYQTYLTATLPIINHYESKGLVYKIEASQTADQVWKEVEKILGNL